MIIPIYFVVNYVTYEILLPENAISSLISFYWFKKKKKVEVYLRYLSVIVGIYPAWYCLEIRQVCMGLEKLRYNRRLSEGGSVVSIKCLLLSGVKYWSLTGNMCLLSYCKQTPKFVTLTFFFWDGVKVQFILGYF